MANLLEKFKNVRFQNWMRQARTNNSISEVKAANDNSGKPDFMVLDYCNLKYPPVSSICRKNDLSEDSVKRLKESDRVDAFRYYFESLPEYRRMMRQKKLKEAFNFSIFPIRQDLEHMLSSPVKLKRPVSLKRKLRQNKARFREIRACLDDIEKSLNEAIFGTNADER